MVTDLPKTLRTIGIALVILGALFKIRHWPWTEVIFIIAWGVTLIAMLWRLLSGQPLLSKDVARDVFTLGLVSVIVISMLHLPGRGYALAVTLLGGIALVWFDRDSFLPSSSDKGSKPWMFYTALVLVISGALFRIQHWPYSTALLIGGLVMVGLWFFASLFGDKAEK